MQDAGWSRFDTLLVSFDQPTDLGGREGGSAFVDTVLQLCAARGSNTWGHPRLEPRPRPHPP